MPIKKIVTFIAMISLIIALVIGCGSSDTNQHENNSIESEGFTGSTFSSILNGLINGLGQSVGKDIMGHLLSLLGWGNSNNSEMEQTLKDIDYKITEICDELATIENELKEVLTEIEVSEDSIKNDVDWPRDAVNSITTATQALQLQAVDKKPGEGNRTEIDALASNILGAQYDIPKQVISIYDSIIGNPTPLLSNYVDQVILELENYDSKNLTEAYQGFEYFTSELLNHQIKGVNLVVEAYHAKDDKSSAKKYLDCYHSNTGGTSECNILYKEIGDMDNNTSFIYNVISMVLRNAPLYGSFLPSSAESIFKRAEFYRLLMTGTDPDEFGVRIFYITTADMEEAPYELTLMATGISSTCNNPSIHKFTGRAYDFWDDNAVKESTDYNVAEYNCGHLPDGKYDIIGIYKPFVPRPLGSVEVSQYDTNNVVKNNGKINYGFALVTKNIDDRFQRSDKWYWEAPSDWNYNSEYSIHMPDSWSIVTKANHHDNDIEESKAGVNLWRSFSYNGTEVKKINVDYSVQFYVDAHSPFHNSQGGGDAYCYYNVGIYDKTVNTTAYFTKYRLHAGSGHEYSGIHDVNKTMPFLAIPNHNYQLFIQVISKECCLEYIHATTNLNEVNHIYFKF